MRLAAPGLLAAAAALFVWADAGGVSAAQGLARAAQRTPRAAGPDGVGAVKAPPPSRAPSDRGASPSDSALAEALATYMDRVADFGFAGVALVGKGDEILHVTAHGMADREAGRAFSTATVSSLGSVTKLYTTAAILGLVGRGALSLADTLGAFVPELPRDRSGITLRQLLSHTSGYGEAPYADEQAVSRELLLHEARTLSLQDPPGANYSYSNLGFSLLGVVLEEATGLPYEAALRREVLVPARAWETGYTLAGWTVDRVAAGYGSGERWGTIIEKFANPDGGPSWVLRANGGLHATVFDVFRFVRAYVDGRIAPPALVAASMQPQEGVDRQGLGWARTTAPDGSRTITHDGSNGYLTASVYHIVDRDLTIVAFANAAETTAIELGANLLEIAAGAEVPVPPAIDPQPLAPSARRAFSGSWSFAADVVRVVDAGETLLLHLEGQDLIDSVLGVSPAMAEAFDADNRRARAIVDAALAGEFADAPVLRRVWRGLESRVGQIDAVDVLGTAPTWYGSPRATWLRFRFGDGSTQVRRLHWLEDGELYGIGGSVYPAPVTLRCAGTAPDACAGAHFRLATEPVRLHRTASGRVELELPHRTLRGRRVSVAEPSER